VPAKSVDRVVRVKAVAAETEADSAAATAIAARAVKAVVVADSVAAIAIAARVAKAAETAAPAATTVARAPRVPKAAIVRRVMRAKARATPAKARATPVAATRVVAETRAAASRRDSAFHIARFERTASRPSFFVLRERAPANGYYLPAT
jgi:hypothetical protein